MNPFSDDQHWRWLFKNGIDWDAIIPLYYPSFPTEDGIETKEELIQFFEEMLTATADWSATSVRNRAEALDRKGAGEVVDGKCIPGEELKGLYQEATELGVFGLCVPRELGGSHAPATLYMMVLGQLARYCMASCTQVAFHSSISDMIHRFLPHEQAEKFVPMINEAKISGAMCLTEPGCGSDLGAIQSTAVPQEDGTFLLSGSKLFITNAGGGLHFTLARIKGDKEGLDGLSMFFVQQEDERVEGNNFTVVKNEEKTGMHGSFTCEVLYENSVCELVGNAGEGFKLMLHLMNEARIAVGIQALGGIEGAIEHAIKYAEERQQFGKPLTELPLMKRNLDDLCTERDAMRALMVDTASLYDVFQFLDLKERNSHDLTKEEQKQKKEIWRKVRKRTPLVKFYLCEQFVDMSKKALQVYGGYGFMKEYPIERYYRDCLGPLLYEGTSQIQSLMALKDFVKGLFREPKNFFEDIFKATWEANPLSGDSDVDQNFGRISASFFKNVVTLLFGELRPDWKKIHVFKEWQRSEAIDDLMEHAETLTWALSYIETLEVLKQHARKDDSQKDLYWKYSRLIEPKLAGIYADWKIRV